jgi:hypothetical protein
LLYLGLSSIFWIVLNSSFLMTIWLCSFILFDTEGLLFLPSYYCYYCRATAL